MSLRKIVILSCLLACWAAAGTETLPGARPLDTEGDIAAAMVAGIDAYLNRITESAVENREAHWKRDFSTWEAYVSSVAENRKRLQSIIGAIDNRVPPEMRLESAVGGTARIGAGKQYEVLRVSWPVLDGVSGEGLLLEPSAAPVANVVALPDCDWTPEALAGLEDGVPAESQFARRLAENDCRVLVPVLIDRRCEYSGVPSIRMTNQPHREFIMRLGFHLGRHIVGYEVQEVLAALDWLQGESSAPLGLIGHGEGGLIAFYAAAIDTRVQATLVSGYFQPRERLWDEPIYRSVWALLPEFGDAEIAGLIAPRSLIVEASRFPEVSGPPELPGRAAAAPGRIVTPPIDEIRAELERARALTNGLNPAPVLELLVPPNGTPVQEDTLARFLAALGVSSVRVPQGAPERLEPVDADARMKRQFDELVNHTQRLMRESSKIRAKFWEKADAASLDSWAKSIQWYRDYLWDEVIGRLPAADVPPNPRARKLLDEPLFEGYEVMLDVYTGVFAYGILLIPKGITPGQRRPVVVCQHGLEGRSDKVADPRVHDPAYNSYGARLAEEGFVVFAPQNPYIGGNDFRQLQRKAHPLKLTLFSFIARQHERILEWLATLPFVDADRIGFYGISYGGKTAMRLGALLPQYKTVICSGDFNEWIWKVVSLEHPFCYIFTHEYEMLEFNLANTFNHAEMSWMMLPRPFMVERGHDDGVSIDEWVAFEYARTRFRYDKLGVGERTEIEFFDGPHCIHGVGTFAFLRKWLGNGR